MRVFVLVIAMILCLGGGIGVGCKSETASQSKAAAEPLVDKKEKAPEGKSSEVARIVFVGQKDACECTRKRIDSSWDELQKITTSHPHLPIERLFLDTEANKVAPYLEMRSLMVAPGVYFLDEAGMLIEMLQGKVTESQIGRIVTR